MAQLIQQDKNVILPKGGVPGVQGRDIFVEDLVSFRVIDKNRAADLKNKFQNAEDIFDNLFADNSIDEEKLVRAYAAYMGAAFTDLKKADPEIIKTIPVRLAEKYLIVPYYLKWRKLIIALAQPTRLLRGDMSVLGEIAQRMNVRVEVSFTTRQFIRGALARLGQPLSSLTSPESAQIQAVDLTNVQIAPADISLLPKEVEEKYKIIVFGRSPEGKIKMGIVNPADPNIAAAIDNIAKENNIEIEKYKISEDSFQKAVAQYPVSSSNQPQEERQPLVENIRPEYRAQNNPAATKDENITLPDKENRSNILSEAYSSPDSNLDKSLNKEITGPNDIKQFIATGNVPQILAAIMKLASKMHASDIHIEAQKDKVLVRVRVDGLLKDIIILPYSLQKAIVARVKILAKLKIDETRIPQDGRFDLVVSGHEIDVRVSVMPTVFGEKVVLRLLDKNAGIFEIKSLGITGDNYKRFIAAIEKPYGVLMVTGPTGAGKSTTLYAAINHLSKRTVNIVTLEDPVEYEIPGINQIQVKPNIGFTFAEGLGAVLRQDPNIIMVGEIRDAETANLVTHASLTGHLVLTTLHTNDASSAMPRLINMGVEPFLIASSMNAIVGQRLVRKICTKCRVEINVPEAVRQEVEKELSILHLTEPIRFFQGKGCTACGNTGYAGRTGIYEVLEVDEGMEQLIISRAPADKIRDYAVSRNMYPMRIDGFIKVISGITTVDEVMRATAIN